MSTHEDVVVRQATRRDVAGILDCLAAAFEPYRTRYTHDAYLDTVLTRERLNARLNSMRVLIAITGKREVIGTIACGLASPAEGHLRGMAVLPEWLGRGIAERLLSSAEAHLRQQGCARITLDTTEPLRRAMRFYEKHGYRPSGRITDFFGMPLHEYVKAIGTVQR
ncbi:MAG TPA: GNAT family N-acetyltransferase [Terriglobales bacterium]|nr:GNAT family N-acetyltransferase [Terriglobales bacterium]